MVYVAPNIEAFARSRETADEIVMAIFEIADEGDEARLWEDPTPEELDQVAARAWQLADADEQTLCWGSFTLHRPL